MIRLPNALHDILGAGGTVVVPSRQRAHAVRVAHAAAQLDRGRRVWPSADVLPLDGWLTREIERGAGRGPQARLPRLLSATEEWLLWRQCTAKATEDLQLVNGAALARELRQAQRLALELQLDLDAVRAAPGTETALLLTVLRGVEQRSRDLGAASANSILARIGALGDARPLMLAGFLHGTPQLRALAEARRAQGWATERPQSDGGGARARVVLPADEVEELDRIADWCRQRLADQPADRLWVVLPGSAGRRERLAALICQALDPRAFLASAHPGGLVAIEGGGALSAQPAVAQALDSLGFLGGEVLAAERLGCWLLAPFWSEPTLEARSRLDLWLRERIGVALDQAGLVAVLEAAPGPLRSVAHTCIARVAQAEAMLRPASGSPREWSERFRAALEALGWPGTRARSSFEQQTLLRWHELLDEFGQLSVALGALNRQTALRHLRELSAETAYRPADEDVAITLSASLADPVVRYDGLWVAGLHAEAFPQPPAPDAFLPLACQLGSPAASAAGRLEQAQALIGAWRAAAGELVLSAPQRIEDLELLPSPLLSMGGAGSSPEPASESVWLALRAHRAQMCEPWEDAGLPWDLRQGLPSGTRSIELQNDCPFRAYAQLRLGCTELGGTEPGVPADFRGRLLHLALQRLWNSLRDSHVLAAMAPLQLEETIADSISQALERLLATDSSPPAPPALARERRRTQRLIRRLLDLERARRAFTVKHTEHDLQIDLQGIGLQARIDRIDALEGGGLAILDYKSGRATTPDWYGERPSHPQLLTYLAPFGPQVVALATVNVTARKVEYQGIAAEAGLLPKVGAVEATAGDEAWPRQVHLWRDVVQRLARDFAAGVATLDPKPGACQYCPVASVCRIAEAGTVGEIGAGERE